MRAKISKKDLLQAVMRTVNIVDRKSVMPILSHVLLDFSAEGLCLKSTDLDHSLIENVPAEIDTYGSVAVSATTLNDIVRKSPEGAILEFNLIDKGEKLSISAGRSHFELSTLAASDFPKISPIEGTCNTLINSECFSKLINKTRISMSLDENRHNLNGIYIHKDGNRLKAASTDGHRLSYTSVPINTSESIQGVILSRKTVYEVKKLIDAYGGDIKFSLNQNQIQFGFGNITFISKLVDGKFPEYERVIPAKEGSFFFVNRSEFIEIVDRISVMSDEKVKAVKLELKKNQLIVNVSNSKLGSGRDELSVDYDGSDWNAGFNSSYLLEVAQVMSGDIMTIYIKDALASILMIDNADADSLFVVMPMRI